MTQKSTAKKQAARTKAARTKAAAEKTTRAQTSSARTRTAVRKSAAPKAAVRKAAVRKTAGSKTAVRKAAVQKNAAVQKTAAQKTAARRATSKRAAGKVARKPVRSAPRPPQRFVVSHHRDEDFAPGLRSYAHYRDLGIAEATHGLAQAHVIRLVGPCDPAEVSKLHYHDIEFQMVYVLKGWVKAEFDGEGAITMQVGSCWIQPPRIRHMILDYSDDCELLEIILPAQFDTVELTA